MILNISETDYLYQLQDLDLEQNFFEESYIIKYNELYCTESEKIDKIKSSLKTMAIELKDYIVEKINNIIKYIKELSMIIKKAIKQTELNYKINSLKIGKNLPFLDKDYLDKISDFITRLSSGKTAFFSKNAAGHYTKLINIHRLLYKYSTLHTKDDMIKFCVKQDDTINEIKQDMEEKGFKLFIDNGLFGSRGLKDLDYSNYESLKKDLNEKIKPERKNENILCDANFKKYLNRILNSITNDIIIVSDNLNDLAKEHDKQAKLCDQILSKIEDDTYREYYFTVQKYAMVVLKFFSMNRQYCTLCIDIANKGYNYLSAYINAAYNTSKSADNKN